MNTFKLLMISSASLLLVACASEPTPPPIPQATVIVTPTAPMNNDACCFQPTELVKYQNKPIPDCTKNVEVIRYKNSCVDCPYPVVIRNNSLCTRN